MTDILDRFVRATKADLLYDPALAREVHTSALCPDPSAEALLRCLLAGTPLDFIRLSTGTFVLVRRAREAPNWGHLAGLVVDDLTGESLPYAHVFLHEAGTGTVTTPDGRFTLGPLLPGRYRVGVSFVGYEPSVHTVQVPDGGGAHVWLRLRPATMSVKPVIVDGLSARLPAQQPLGRSEITVEGTEASASVVTASLRRVPGVRVGGVFSDVSVQGGASGEHQLRLDGAPVFVPLNITGHIGPFSELAIERVTAHKAGFAPREGSHLSGVITAEHTLGSQAPTDVDFRAGPLGFDTRFRWRSGTPGGVSSMGMIAARADVWGVYRPPALRRFLDEALRPDTLLVQLFPGQLQHAYGGGRYFLESRDPILHYNDLHGAVRFRFGALHSVYASAFRGYKALSAELIYTPLSTTSAFRSQLPPPPDRDYYAWVNEIAQVRYERVLTSRVLGHVQVRRSHYELTHELSNVLAPGQNTSPSVRTLDDGNRLTEHALTARLDIAAARTIHLEAGGGITRTTLRFFLGGDLNRELLHNRTSDRLHGFLQARAEPWPGTVIEAGMRATSLVTVRRSQVFAEPRVGVRHDRLVPGLGRVAFRVAGGLYRQYLNQFDLTSLQASPLRTAVRFWLPTDATVDPPKAYHLSAEVLWQPSRKWDVHVEAYRKWQPHLLAFNYAALRPVGLHTPEPFPANVNQSAFLEHAEGVAYGISIDVARRFSHGAFDARYEYNQAHRQSANRFEGERYPVSWAEPHRLRAGATLTPTPRLTLQARGEAVWQRPWGFAPVYYDYLEHANPALRPYSIREPGAHILPPLYQLDLSASYDVTLGDGTLQLRAEVINALDRRNVGYWELQGYVAGAHPDGTPLLRYRRVPQYLLPRMPMLSAHFSW